MGKELTQRVRHGGQANANVDQVSEEAKGVRQEWEATEAERIRLEKEAAKATARAKREAEEAEAARIRAE